jgi:hypothetical protein
MRTLNKSYWEEEVPSSEEMSYASQNLTKYNNKIDYVITHTIPRDLLPILGFDQREIDPTTSFLNFIASTVHFDQWYCGHMHIDKDISKYSLLWNRIVKII